MCTIQSRVTQEYIQVGSNDSFSYNTENSTRTHSCTVRNVETQLPRVTRPSLDVPKTINQQLKMEDHGVQPFLGTFKASVIQKWLVHNSAHELSPALSAFAVLAFELFQLYNEFSFDKLHAFYIGIT